MTHSQVIVGYLYLTTHGRYTHRLTSSDRRLLEDIVGSILTVSVQRESGETILVIAMISPVKDDGSLKLTDSQSALVEFN